MDTLLFLLHIRGYYYYFFFRVEEKFAGGKFRGRKISRNSSRSGYYFRGRKISRKIEIRENSEIKLHAKNWCYAVRLMHRICAYAVRHVRLTCAAMDIAESSCTPRSRMLVDAMMLHPQMSMQSGCGCGMRLFGAANTMASVFVSFKSRQP